MRPNRLRELLDADLPSLGTHIMSTWPSVIELAGNSGQCARRRQVSYYMCSTVSCPTRNALAHLARFTGDSS